MLVNQRHVVLCLLPYPAATPMDAPCYRLQNEVKAKGHPWTMAKCFDTACPVSAFVPRDRVADTRRLRLHCAVNGEVRQDGATADMHFSVPFLLSYISRSVAAASAPVAFSRLICCAKPPRLHATIHRQFSASRDGQI